MAGQLAIEFECDGRTERLAAEFAVMLAPRMLPGTPAVSVQEISSRLAVLAERRFRDAWEPTEPIRCHTCDDMTLPKTRVRVAVCTRCSAEGRSPGSAG